MSHIHPYPISTPAAQCDDEQVINSKIFSNTLNYTWDVRPNAGFWKHEASGRSLITGHKFKIWDVETAYRGAVDCTFTSTSTDEEGGGENNNNNNNTQQLKCPRTSKTWISIPEGSITEEKLNATADRALRQKQWFQYFMP